MQTRALHGHLRRTPDLVGSLLLLTSVTVHTTHVLLTSPLLRLHTSLLWCETSETRLYRFVALRPELANTSLCFCSQSSKSPAGTWFMDTADRLCCSIFKALSLDPAPVLGDALYVPGAEGVRLAEVKNFTEYTCPDHRFNFTNSLRLLQSKVTPCGPRDCSCVLWERQSRKQRCRERTVDDRSSSVVASETAGCDEADRSQLFNDASVLWAYELNHIVTAYGWIMKNRTQRFVKCSNAVLVYQPRRSRVLPPGLYIYAKKPRHIDCTAERPICVIEQFAGQIEPSAELPERVFIDVFPGRDNYSAVYAVSRTLSVVENVEYSNRVFGELSAMALVDYRSTVAVACKHHQVAIRNKTVYVLDLRWNGMNTKTDCLKAIPKLRGIKALIWSNHNENNQDIEANVLSWLSGHTNQLPTSVNLIDYTTERNGIRYIILDIGEYKSKLPRAPRLGTSVFMPVYFIGDRKLASQAIGTLPTNMARMGSPCTDPALRWYALPSLGFCNPTPFSHGTLTDSTWQCSQEDHSRLVEWTLQTAGSECSGLAVQYTLYYHEIKREYKMMMTHTLPDAQDMCMFRL